MNVDWEMTLMIGTFYLLLFSIIVGLAMLLINVIKPLYFTYSQILIIPLTGITIGFIVYSYYFYMVTRHKPMSLVYENQRGIMEKLWEMFR